MPDSLQSLCDLVELRAAKHHIALTRLWKQVFAAIRDGELDFGFPDEFESEYGSLKHRIPLPRPWAPDQVPEIMIETLCDSALRAIESGDAFDPWKQGWVRHMLVSAAAFDKALFPADQNEPLKDAVVSDEERAIEALATHLKQMPDCTRANAADWCRQGGLTFSDRGFQSRIWPRARGRAGLSEKASAGRKRKTIVALKLPRA
jgi:hypothetical protein